LIFRILLGEQAASVVVGAYLPFWFLEGDAVVTETAFSHAGRGRLASFSMELKAQADEKGIYSFDKAYLGSYKDYIPDYYQLGYQMVSNIRNQYGGEVWSKVLHHIARNPLALNSLSKGLKLATGKNQDQHYLTIMNNLKNTKPFNFENQIDASTGGKFAVHSSKFYTSYRYPYFVNDSTIVALKISLDKIPYFVMVDRNQTEKKLFIPGPIVEESASYANGKIIWIEIKTDARWAQRESSLIRILDVNSRVVKEKSFTEKLFAPVISPDGKTIATVKFNDQNLCSILLISTTNFQIINELKVSDTSTILTPSWSEDQKFLYAVELNSQGKTLVRIDAQSGSVSSITDSVNGEIRKPVQRKNYLYFIANMEGKDEGYALNLTTNKSHKILSAKYGIKDLQSSSDGNGLLYGDYTSNGFKIAKEGISTSKWEDVSLHKWFQDTLSNNRTIQEKGAIDFSHLDTSLYKTSRYVKLRNLFNVHSWSPIYVDPDQSRISTGFSVVSQNKLTTAVTQLGYDYSSVNRTGKWVGKIEYSGWYPVLRFYGDYEKENDNYYQINRHYNSNNQLVSQDTVSVSYVQRVMNLHLDIAIPFNLTHGKMWRMIEPEFQIGYSHHWQDPTTPSMIFRGSYIPLTYRLYVHNLMQQSQRDLQPKWGQILDFQFRHTPFGDRRLGLIASAEGTFYIPGLITNQGLRFYAGFQRKVSDNSYFSDLIYYPRGYVTRENTQLMTLRSDYVLPVLTPDWHIWHLYYLKRVSLRVYHDFARIFMPIHKATAGSGQIIKNMTSTGAELVTECHFLRFLAPVKIGIRESYLTESKTFASEFIFSFNLKGM
jgi:hypothetical protein